jgi:hypothetical protein
MKNLLPLALLLLGGLISPAQADHDKGAPFRQGTPVVIVGQVTSKPHKVLGVVEKRLQIALGTSANDTYTLHVKDAEMVGMNGQKLAASDMDDKQWVRAEGTIMDDPHRIKVNRLEVVARDFASVKKTKFFRTGFDRGYIDAVSHR